MRVVLYAEGAGEIAAEDTHFPGAPFVARAPGEALPDDALGPGHILTRRVLAAASGVDVDGIQFEQPLRDRGRIVRGSMLLNPQILRGVLTWLDRTKRPDVAIVLVDADGRPIRDRRKAVTKGIPAAGPPLLIGVAKQEFESWLVADPEGVSDALGASVSRTKKPETMKSREAKQLLRAWVANSPRSAQEKTARVEVARHVDLEVIASRCPSFRAFCRDAKSLSI